MCSQRYSKSFLSTNFKKLKTLDLNLLFEKNNSILMCHRHLCLTTNIFEYFILHKPSLFNFDRFFQEIYDSVLWRIDLAFTICNIFSTWIVCATWISIRDVLTRSIRQINQIRFYSNTVTLEKIWGDKTTFYSIISTVYWI